MEVTVVGAGIIGLTTALTLQERGHRVRVVAAATRRATTSAIAGAVWFPYRVGPPGASNVWAARTRRWLESLARATPDAGVDVLTGYEITPERRCQPWWAAYRRWKATARHRRRRRRARAGARHRRPDAWKFTAPRAQPSLFLPWLEAKLRAPIEQRVVTDLAAEPGEVVINCTGLGARELSNDDLLIPLLGQIVIAERGTADITMTVTDDRDPDAIFYIIPRRDELVLGGCSMPFPPGAEPEIDDAISARILASGAKRSASPSATVRTERVGLRPYRAEVRLERDGAPAHHPQLRPRRRRLHALPRLRRGRRQGSSAEIAAEVEPDACR